MVGAAISALAVPFLALADGQHAPADHAGPGSRTRHRGPCVTTAADATGEPRRHVLDAARAGSCTIPLSRVCAVGARSGSCRQAYPRSDDVVQPGVISTAWKSFPLKVTPFSCTRTVELANPLPVGNGSFAAGTVTVTV